MNSWHSLVSIVGGVSVGFAAVEAADRWGWWWSVALLPVWLVVLALTLLLPYRVDEWLAHRRWLRSRSSKE